MINKIKRDLCHLFLPFLILLNLVLNISLHAQKRYSPEISDPMLEPWRWKKFTELDAGAYQCMTEDDDGNLWFLLDHHKLLQYDGYEWIEHTIPDSVNPINLFTRNSIYSITVIKNALYIKGRSVIVKFENGEFTSMLDISDIRAFRLYQVLELGNGIIAAPSSHGLFLFGDRSIAYTSSESKTKEIEHLCPDFRWKKAFENFKKIDYKILLKKSSKQLLLICNSSTSLITITNDTENPLKFGKRVNGNFKAAISPKVVQLPNGDVWLGSYQGRVPFYRYRNGVWETISIADLFGGNDAMKSMQYTSMGVMYVGGKGGVFAYKNNNWIKYSSPDIPFTSEYIEIYETKSGDLWIGAVGGEVYKVEHSDKRWQTHKNLAYQLTDTNKKQWFIARDNKIVFHQGKKWYYYDTSDGVIDTPVLIIELSDGTIICAGSDNRNAAVCKLQHHKWEKAILPVGWGIHKNTAYEDEYRQLWLGSEQPLSSRAEANAGFVILKNYDFGSLQFDTLYNSNSWRFRYPQIGIVKDKSGNLLMGDSRMALLYNSNGDHKIFELNGEVNKILNTPSGTIWGSTEMNGMFVLKNEDGIYRQEFIPVQGNFLSKNILDFYIHHDSSIYVITNKDVTYYDGETWINSIFKNYFRFENRGAQVKVEGDKVWINIVPSDWTFRALNTPEIKKEFRSIVYTPDTIPPITNITFYNKVVDKSGNTLVKWEGLDYFNQTSKKDMLFSFQLNEAKWTPYTNSRQQHFIGLKHGKYTLSVRSKDKNGNIDKDPAKISFRVLPPVWMRPWFLAMIAIFVFTTIFLIRKIIVRNKRLAHNNIQLKEKQEEILAQNEEIQQQAEELESQRDSLEESHIKVVRSLQQLETISEFGQKLTSTLSIDSIHDMMYEYVNNIIDFQAFGIGVLDEVNRNIVYPSFMEEGNKLPPMQKSLDDENSLTAWCVNNQKPIIIGDVENEYNKYVKNPNFSATQNITYSRLHLPLTVKDKRIGILVINSYKKNAYQHDDLINMQTVASYISIALDNAKAYEQINDKNKAIKESITYAQSIQSAFMPAQDQLDKYFNCFVLFKPKDIVSGDFAWFSPIEKDMKKPLKAFMCIADCTGHGVPGALVSSIGNNLLDKYINVIGERNPAQILKLMNEGFQHALKQEETQNNDGMDMALIYLEEEGRGSRSENPEGNNHYKISFSGAKNPLIIYRVQKGELEFIKGSRKSIGGLRSRSSKSVFEKAELMLQTGDVIYMFTDGIIDQHSPTRERYTRERLMILLNQVAKFELEKQKVIIEREISMHMQNERQTDDITFMGIRL